MGQLVEGKELMVLEGKGRGAAWGAPPGCSGPHVRGVPGSSRFQLSLYKEHAEAFSDSLRNPGHALFPRPQCLLGAPAVCQTPAQSRERDPQGRTRGLDPTHDNCDQGQGAEAEGDSPNPWARQFPTFSPCFSSACSPLS